MMYYERYFYIAASTTFPGRGRGLLPGNDDKAREELVLDIPQGTAVILQKKVKFHYTFPFPYSHTHSAT